MYTDNPRRESTRELTEDHDIVELRELEPIENDTKPHHTRRTRSDWRNFCELALPPRDLCAMCVETLQGAAHDAPSARRFVKIVAALIAEIPQRAPIADAADVVWRLFLVRCLGDSSYCLWFLCSTPSSLAHTADSCLGYEFYIPGRASRVSAQFYKGTGNMDRYIARYWSGSHGQVSTTHQLGS